MIAGARYVHTNLIARDWKRLADFYESVFGCVPVPPERNYSGPTLEALTAIPGASLAGVHLRLPGGGEADAGGAGAGADAGAIAAANGPTLEIFQYAAGTPESSPAVNRPGFAHLAFEVDSVSEARAEVLAAGGSAVGEVAVLTTAAGRRVTACYVTDPEGNVIELMAWDRA